MTIADSLEDRCRFLESQLDVLQHENDILTERGEETLLLGLVSECLQAGTEPPALLADVLERIAVLKDIPYCACYIIEGGADSIRVLADYAQFSDHSPAQANISLPPEHLAALKQGDALLLPEAEFGPLKITLADSPFLPKIIAAIPCMMHVYGAGFFLFADDTDPDHLPGAQLLLQRVVELTVARLDNLSLMAELQTLNAELDRRVISRTLALQENNIRLQQEVEDRRRAEAALALSEYHYRTLIEVSPVAIFVYAEGKFVFLNPAAVAMHGAQSEAELIGKPIVDFLLPEYRPLLNRQQKQAQIAPQQPRQAEARIRRLDGGIIDVHVTAISMTYDDKPAHLVICQDVTAQKQSESALKRTNQELTLLNRIITASLEAETEDAILTVACRELGRVLNAPHVVAMMQDGEAQTATIASEYVDEAGVPFLGFSFALGDTSLVAQLVDSKKPVYVANAQTDPTLALFRPVLREAGVVSLLMLPIAINQIVEGALLAVWKQEFLLPPEAINQLQHVADQVGGSLARLRLEVTHRQLEEQYQHAQRLEAIGRLTGGIAHDFNNILMAINGFSELLQRKLPIDSDQHRMAAQILRSGERAADLVQQLLAFSRKQIIQPKIINLNQCVQSMGTMLQRIIGEDIVLRTRLLPDLWPVKVDPAQLEQIIINLAINARDAMPNGGQLTLTTDNVTLTAAQSRQLDLPPGDFVRLRISDTGEGIGEETQAHIFEPFFTTKEQGKGTGLGLATVFGTVKQHNGAITVKSRPGQGTTFQIVFPRMSEETPPPAPDAALSLMPSTGNETILLVEDEAAVRNLAKTILDEAGYTTLTAKNGSEALQVAQDRHIDLLITDVIMPGMSGQQLADRLSQQQPDLNVLFISGYSANILADQGKLRADIALLQKPFSVMTFSQKVREALDKP